MTLTDKLRAVQEALATLIAAKDEKDTHGESEHYQELKRNAWDNARIALALMPDLIKAVEEMGTSPASEDEDAIGVMHYFDPENWEYTTTDKSLVLDYLDCAKVFRMGRFARLTDLFVAQRYNEEADEYETKEFAAIEEAEAWRKEPTHE